MQKLRWTERGWSRGFSYCSWKFQSRSGVGGDDGEQVEGSGLRLGRHCALGNCGGGGANGLRFAPTEREFGGAGPNGCAAWPRHAWTWRSYWATELHVMVLGPTSGRALSPRGLNATCAPLVTEVRLVGPSGRIAWRFRVHLKTPIRELFA